MKAPKFIRSAALAAAIMLSAFPVHAASPEIVRRDAYIRALRADVARKDKAISALRSAIDHYDFVARSAVLERSAQRDVLDASRSEVGKIPYVPGNQCLEHSQTLCERLLSAGIMCSIARSDTHAWSLVWIEATDGEFVSKKDAMTMAQYADPRFMK